jgi:hypothetical protein
VASWGRLVAGVVIGVAGTIYATNEDVRKKLPKAARDFPDNVRSRYKSAVSAARGVQADPGARADGPSARAEKTAEKSTEESE